MSPIPSTGLPLGVRLIGWGYLALAFACGAMWIWESRLTAIGAARIPENALRLVAMLMVTFGIVGMCAHFARRWAWQVFTTTQLLIASMNFLFAAGWFVFEMWALSRGGRASGIALAMLPVVVGVPIFFGVLALGAWSYVRRPEVRAAYGAGSPAQS